MVVEAALGQRPGLLFGQLDVPAPEQVRHRAVVDSVQLHHQARMPGPAPFDLALGAVDQESGPGVEPISEVCQGYDLYSSFQSVCTGNLSDSDHAPSPLPECLDPRGAGSEAEARSTNTRFRSRSDATRTSVRTASMLRPALPMNLPTSPSASFTLIAIVPPPRSVASTTTSSGLSASDFATYSTSAL